MGTTIELGLTLPGGRKYILRDDGYRVYAREEGTTEDMEECVFEYKHSDQNDAHAIVQMLLRAAAGMTEDIAHKLWMESGDYEKIDFYEWCAKVFLFRTLILKTVPSGHDKGTPRSVSPDWKSDGTGFRDEE